MERSEFTVDRFVADFGEQEFGLAIVADGETEFSNQFAAFGTLAGEKLLDDFAHIMLNRHLMISLAVSFRAYRMKTHGT